MFTIKTKTYLIQLSGSFLQSVLHLNRSQASQPMGGVKASPLSRPDIFPSRHNTTHTVHKPTDFHNAITPVKKKQI